LEGPCLWGAEPAAFEKILSLDVVDTDADGNLDQIAATQGPGYLIWFDNQLAESWRSYATFDSRLPAKRLWLST
jgi:hypothetical protein